MYSLHPTLWRTCRALANIKRIELLYALFEHPNLCVFELAQATDIRPEHASLHLRTLSSRGLIRQTRQKMRLICCADANRELEAPSLLLEALRACHKNNMPAELILKQATAFTHRRRIEIIQAVSETGSSRDALHNRTNISYSALTRNLNKLEARGFVNIGRNFVKRSVPPDPLSKALLRIILSGDKPDQRA